MAKATITLVSQIRAKQGKKSHIKIYPPAGGPGFDRTTVVTAVTDTGNGLSWAFTALKSSNLTRLKYSIQANARVPAGPLPDAGTITVTLSPLPTGAVIDVESLDVDYVDEAD
jgi:hypothetical protein